MVGGHGFGNVGLGIGGDPPKDYPRPDRCANHDHPGITYNPWMDQTVCLCGLVWRAGSVIDWPYMVGEPLHSSQPRPDGWEQPVGSRCLLPVREAVQLDLFGVAA